MTGFQYPPNIMPLSKALKLVDKVYKTETILDDRGKDQTKEYYKQSLPGYEKFYNGAGAMHMALDEGDTFTDIGLEGQVKWMRRALEGREVNDILELGSGGGYNLVRMARAFPTANVTGIDMLHDHVVKARQRAHEARLGRVKVHHARFEQIPKLIGQLDLIYSVEALCYAEDLPALFSQVASRLRPGGYFIVFDSFRNFQPEELPKEYADALEIAEVTVAVTKGFHSPQAWRAALDQAGLELVADDDLTAQTLPCLTMLHERCTEMGGGFKRMLIRQLPVFLGRHGASGLMGYYAHAPMPGREDGLGPLGYRVFAARKPG